MKKILLSFAALLLVATPVFAGDYSKSEAKTDKAEWFDFSCAMCSNLTAQEGLLDNLGWDHYPTDDGVFVVSTVPADYADKWATACTDMKAVGEKMATGAEMHLCGHCGSMMGLQMNPDIVVRDTETDNGHITMMMGKTPEAVQAIHKHVKTTQHAMKAMMEGAES